MPLDPNRKGRGVVKVQPASFASATGVTDALTGILTGIADHVYVVHRITFHYPTDITSSDFDLRIDGIYQDGTAYDFMVIEDDGDTTEISTVINTWVNPNPPANTVICYKEFPTGIPLATSDTISLVGNDSTAANNYTSTAAVAMKVVIDYEDVDAGVYYQNRLG